MLSKKKISNHSIVNLSLSVAYQSEFGKHKDTRHFEKFNVWRDIDLLPQKIQTDLPGKTAGYRKIYPLDAGELNIAKTNSLLYHIENKRFNRNTRIDLKLEPRFGRYYPKGWFSGIHDNYSENSFPARVVGLDKQSLMVDFNHPLAGYELDFEVEIFGVYESFEEHGGRCNDCMTDLLAGPGMQLRYQGQATDFFIDQPFHRSDEANDEFFYTVPRLVNHIDVTAAKQIEELYASLITDNAKVLDLMSSIHSHLPQDLKIHSLTGLGLNQEELEQNPRLDEQVVHNLNARPILPFSDECFDTVICSLAIEYLNKPANIFKEVARVLKPGGNFILTFSNRWFPTKAIHLWMNLHEFERMGLVSEYFINSGRFENINSYSVRGLVRPEEDRYNLPMSDPVYAVWATTK